MNTRDLNDIAAEIHAADRKRIFDVGDLLIEARAQCEHGQWLDWLNWEFEWSADTAARYMAVAELGTKFRKLRNLRLGKCTLYDLLNKDDEDLPAILDELAKHARKKTLSREVAWRFIEIGIARREFGDLPDATLYALRRPGCFDDAYEEVAKRLKECMPETDEEAKAIIRDVCDRIRSVSGEGADDADDQDDAGEDDDDIAAILDGPPPALPKSESATSQRFESSEKPSLEVHYFREAVDKLCWISTRANVAVLAEAVTALQLTQAASLLNDVLATSRDKTDDVARAEAEA